MSVQTEIARIAQAKTDIKNVVNSKVANTITNQTIDAFPPLIDSSIAAYKNLIPWIEGSGSSFAIDNAEAGKLDKFEMYGTDLYQNTLPNEYQEVEYIESSGTQYIDTGIKPNGDLQIITELKVLTYYGGNNFFYGGRTFVGQNAFACGAQPNIIGSYGENNDFSSLFNLTLNEKHIIDQTNKLIIDNITIYDFNKQTFTSDNNIYIFALNNGLNGVNFNSHCKLYNMKIYENNILARDFVPCYRKADNEIGLYDFITNTFFTNQGTGSFIMGNLTPSPNPDYPQDVRVVTGEQDIEVSGKNLAKSKTVYSTTNNYAKVLYVDFDIKPNTTYTFSFNGTSGNTVYFNENIFTTANYVTISNNRVESTVTTKSTILSNQYEDGKGWAILKNAAGNTNANVFDDLQVEYGSTATPYEPYQSQTYPINLGNMELCKIGTYQDYIYKDSGKWYKHSEISKVILDGSENWSRRAFPDNSYLSTKMTLNVGENGGYCDYFISNNNYDVAIEHMTISKEWEQLCFAILKSRLSTGDSAGFKSWLSTHNIIVYYVLATPTNTEITDTTLISQLNAIETYTGTNTFSVSNNNGVLPDLYVLTEKQNSYKN